jgi:hypothetical protein
MAFVASDDRGVDRTDRDACDPFRIEAEVAQGLECAGLIGAECAAALEYEDAL